MTWVRRNFSIIESDDDDRRKSSRSDMSAYTNIPFPLSCGFRKQHLSVSIRKRFFGEVLIKRLLFAVVCKSAIFETSLPVLQHFDRNCNYSHWTAHRTIGDESEGNRAIDKTFYYWVKSLTHQKWSLDALFSRVLAKCACARLHANKICLNLIIYPFLWDLIRLFLPVENHYHKIHITSYDWLSTSSKLQEEIIRPSTKWSKRLFNLQFNESRIPFWMFLLLTRSITFSFILTGVFV